MNSECCSARCKDVQARPASASSSDLLRAVVGLKSGPEGLYPAGSGKCHFDVHLTQITLAASRETHLKGETRGVKC